MLRRWVRYILRILRRIRSEMHLFGKSVCEVLQALIDRGIQSIMLKYNCMQIRNRMTNVRSTAEWESYARLLDHLEGTVNWKYVERTKKYDYARLESRR